MKKIIKQVLWVITFNQITGRRSSPIFKFKLCYYCVSVLYGLHSRSNFVTWVIDELSAGNKINVVMDQYSPTLADNVAEAIINIFEKDKEGIYHTACGERINRFDFAKNIAEVFNLDKGLINPIKGNELVQKAKRPKDSSLCVEKAKVDLKMKMLNTLEGLNEMKRSYRLH